VTVESLTLAIYNPDPLWQPATHVHEVFTMKAFRVTGKFKMGRNFQNFTKDCAANDEKGARENIYSILGSKHNVARKYIKIDKVVTVAVADVKDPVAQHKLGV
jgi:large subunit ribosomal protein LX